MALHIKDGASRRARLLRLAGNYRTGTHPGLRDTFQRLWESLNDLHIEGPVQRNELRVYTVLHPNNDEPQEFILWTSPHGVHMRDVISVQDSADAVTQVLATKGDEVALRNHILHHRIA